MMIQRKIVEQKWKFIKTIGFTSSTNHNPQFDHTNYSYLLNINCVFSMVSGKSKAI